MADTVAIVVEKKREEGGVVEDVKKKREREESEVVEGSPEAKCAAVPDLIVPKGGRIGLRCRKDPLKFYVETYDKFDPDCVVAEGDPQTSRVGGGKMLFIKYMDKATGVMRPLMVQSPKVFLPAGIMEYTGEGGKVNANCLCSLGREWESNASMVAFRQLCDKVQAACVRIIMNKQLNLPYCQKEEDVAKAFTPIVSESEKMSEDDPAKIVKFPPSFKLCINTGPAKRSLLVTRTVEPDGTCSHDEISHHCVIKGSAMVPMINFVWVYRRKRSNPNGWTFSMNAAVHEAVVESPQAGGPAPTATGSEGLSVVF